MVSRRLAVSTVKRNPDTGDLVLLVGGSVPPTWAATLIGPDDPIWEPGEGEIIERLEANPGPGHRPEPPPKGGPGSGREAWATYADQVGFVIDDEMSREEIIERLEAEVLNAP